MDLGELGRVGTASRRPPLAAAWLVRSGFIVLGLVWLVVAYGVVPGVRQAPGFHPVYDGWFQCGGYVLAALLAAPRALVPGPLRAVWGCVGLALALRAFGFLWQVLVVRPAGGDHPTLADAGWLASGVALVVAFALLARFHLPRSSPTLVLDAVLGGVTAAALATALLYGTVLRLAAPGTPPDVVATNLAYPLVDVTALMLIAGLFAATQWRVSVAPLVLGAGLVAISVVDSVFLYQVSVGSFRPGTVLTPLSLAGTVLVALAVWLPAGRRAPAPEGAPGLVVPGLMALVCVGVLVHNAPRVSPTLSTLLAAAGIALALLRAYVTLVVDRRVAGATIAEKQQELQRFSSLVEASSDFIAIAGVDGRVAYVNPAGRAMVGLAPDADVTRTTIADYLTEEGIRASLEIEQPAVIAQGHWEGESTLRDLRGGPPTPVAINSFLMRHPDTGEPWLLATVQRDLSERIASEQAVRELADQRQTLLDHLVQAQEDERSRIAADVHDDSVQALAAVELRLSLLHRELARDHPGLLPTVEDLRASVGGATERLRHLLFDLESPAQRSELPDALAEAATYVLEDAVEWRIDGDGGRSLPTGTRVTAYRIAKEALTNIRKHASARHVVIGLHDRDGGVEVTVTDDGRGFGPAQAEDRPGHLGLPGMRDRVAVAGGQLQVDSEEGTGTTVRVWLPVEPGPADD